ncbi:hypothetical protein LTR99_003792 [Exophiala xenobiotica]|uniref:NAD(P)-binding protein n=1 Tax=Vermiconidia calcicola TaxID=1690605 RepID=A0AAV9PYC2_9PEZI|nr:hypothetical protein LTR99_003792 [Exophiala xenobiotica]KAK5435260.1 hypothetical protein LTR34_002763 [Exophiala xenobiotica]KAK5531485.1 hypothetical protein LTR25_008594 [Vermiconidia calcicola]KAK5544728.1 hypothetical protein LTR23_004168 [Chaetothyriales sp. CCFEE 6169]
MVSAPSPSPSTSKFPSSSKSPSPPSPTQQPRPWYRFITLDLLLLILANSVFHPYITFIFYLCIAALHRHREPVAHYTLWYTAFLAVVEVGVWANQRVTYGRHRKVRWEDEVVIITGGGSGLGRVLAEMFLRKGVKGVAVLDVKEPDEEAREAMERWDLVWEVVDVSKVEDVKKAVERVVTELGAPTILINNAATGVAGLPLLTSSSSQNQAAAAAATLSPDQASRTMTINCLSHFNTLSALLPYLTSSKNKTGAHIVTISSILAHLSPASLADYSASKAAVSSLHSTLCHELRCHPDPSVFSRVKTLLVEPGQLDTQLFADITSVPFYAHFFGPVLRAQDVAKEIIRTIERGDGGVIRMPFYAKCMPFFNALPGSVQLGMRWFSGIDRAIVSENKKA